MADQIKNVAKKAGVYQILDRNGLTSANRYLARNYSLNCKETLQTLCDNPGKTFISSVKI